MDRAPTSSVTPELLAGAIRALDEQPPLDPEQQQAISQLAKDFRRRRLRDDVDER